ncbi:hypothetical protein YDYSG_15930 [Paenibacillus tyrfis]|nr:hypothetical protein YDYSG_15930 [Paenibacillus tyrfis]
MADSATKFCRSVRLIWRKLRPLYFSQPKDKLTDSQSKKYNECNIRLKARLKLLAQTNGCGFFSEQCELEGAWRYAE